MLLRGHLRRNRIGIFLFMPVGVGFDDSFGLEEVFQHLPRTFKMQSKMNFRRRLFPDPETD
jgi:hypothetical protein